MFNGWKAQLLRELYAETASRFNAGTALAARGERLTGPKPLSRNCSIRPGQTQIKCLYAPPIRCLLAQLPTEAQVRHADMIAAMEAGEPMALEVHGDKLRDCSEIPLSAKTMRAVCPSGGACALAGLTILDARITTTRDGLALMRCMLPIAVSRAFIIG